MENGNAKKGGKFLKVLGILLAIAGVCFVAYKLYKKFFKKDQPALEAEAEEVDVIAEESVAEEVVIEEETFEVPAEAVLANAEELEA